jgi:hypothetical protein
LSYGGVLDHRWRRFSTRTSMSFAVEKVVLI